MKEDIIKLFDWAVDKSERPRHRWHNLFYNFIAFSCDIVLNVLIPMYTKYTRPYGMFSSEDDS